MAGISGPFSGSSGNTQDSHALDLYAYISCFDFGMSCRVNYETSGQASGTARVRDTRTGAVLATCTFELSATQNTSTGAISGGGTCSLSYSSPFRAPLTPYPSRSYAPTARVLSEGCVLEVGSDAVCVLNFPANTTRQPGMTPSPFVLELEGSCSYNWTCGCTFGGMGGGPTVRMGTTQLDYDSALLDARPSTYYNTSQASVLPFPDSPLSEFLWQFDEGVAVESLDAGARYRHLFPGAPLWNASGQLETYPGTVTVVAQNGAWDRIPISASWSRTHTDLLPCRSGDLICADDRAVTNTSSASARLSQRGALGLNTLSAPGAAFATNPVVTHEFARERQPRLDARDGRAYLLLQNAQSESPNRRRWFLRRSDDLLLKTLPQTSSASFSPPVLIWPDTYKNAAFCLTSDGGMATIAVQSNVFPYKLVYKWSPDPERWEDAEILPSIIGPVEVATNLTSLFQLYSIRQQSQSGSPRLIISNGSSLFWVSANMGRDWRAS